MRSIDEHFRAIDAINGVLSDILDRLPIGVVVVGFGCEVCEMNELAQEYSLSR